MLISYKKANIYQRHGIRVLKDVNFQVEEGQFVYIIGRVGSGKTSLLRTLYFELDMDEADEAKVFDYDLLSLRQKDIPGLRRQMGVVFQDFQLLGDRTVYKNLQFVLKATGWKKKDEIDQRINEVLSDVGLQDKADKMPHELSGGEQQRVAIARAILNKPKLIIADEPTGNLDPETAEDIIELLRKISQTGTAVVMSTHNMPLLDKYPGVVYRCAGGKMEEVTSDFNQIQLVDEPDTDEIIVRYSEREEI
jgi:cell division transport system ATP-binding protein